MPSFSLGGSRSRSRSYSNDRVWAPQEAASGQMFRDANTLWGNQGGSGFFGLGSDADWAEDYNRSIADSARGGQANLLGGGSYGDNSAILNRLFGSMDDQNTRGTNTGRMYESIVGGPGNTYIEPMVQAMRTASQENLDRNLGMGSLDAVGAGQSGSSRHAMADAMLRRGALQDLNMNEANLRGAAYDTDLNMRLDIARLADQNVNAQQDRLLGMLQGRDENIRSGVGFGSDMQNLGLGTMDPNQRRNLMPWQMMQLYSDSIGSPTVLNSSRSRGSGFGMGGGAQWGR